MKLEHLLLGVLLHHPGTGYDLKRFLDLGGKFLRPRTQMSQVYRCLNAMEERGWVVHTVEERPGAQDAKTYRVTDEGAVVFLDWLTGPYTPALRFQDSDLRPRIVFGGFASPADLIRILDIEISTRQVEIRQNRDRDRSFPPDADIPFDTELDSLVGDWSHRTGAAAVDAHVAGCIELRDALLARFGGETTPANGSATPANGSAPATDSATPANGSTPATDPTTPAADSAAPAHGSPDLAT